MGLIENRHPFWNWSAEGLGMHSWKDVVILTAYLLLVLCIGLQVGLAQGVDGAGTWAEFDPSRQSLRPTLHPGLFSSCTALRGARSTAA